MEYSIIGDLSLEQAAEKLRRERLLCAGVSLAAVVVGAALYLLHTPQIRTLCLILCILLDSAAFCFAYGFWVLRVSADRKQLALAGRVQCAERCTGVPRAAGAETVRVQGLDVYTAVVDEGSGTVRTVFYLHRGFEPLFGTRAELTLVDNIVIRAGEADDENEKMGGASAI